MRREAKLLLREVRKALRRHAHRLSDSVAERLDAGAIALSEALSRGDRDAVRVGILELSELAERHLSFARKSTLREYAESIGIAVFIALFLRAFVVEAFKIPSGSMIPTMEIGDHIFVNKFLYGIHIPFTDVKLFEVRAPRRGEVIVFVYPCDRDKDFIKRIVAVEGDTVEVRCNVLYVNGEKVPQEHAPHDSCSYWDYNDKYDQVEGTWDLRSCPTATPASPWAKCNCSSYVETHGGHTYETIYRPGRPFEGDYQAPSDFPQMPRPAIPPNPNCETPEWRARELGEFVDTARTASPCQLQRHYVVPEGYVFVMGDNREKSSDSRVWGPVPVEDIKGKALFIWWSSKPDMAGGHSWGRIGKIVE